MQKIENLFDKIYKAISLFALSCLITPFMYIIGFDRFRLSRGIAFVLALVLLIIGYFVQAGFAKITRIKRKQQDLSYESNTKYFSITQAALPIVICVGISIVLYRAAVAYLRYRVELGIDLDYDPYSVFPFVMMAMGSIIMIIGVIAWFYPYNRILSMRSLFTYFSLLLMAFIFPFSVQSISTFCMILFVLCALIILNQSNILRTISLTKIGIATARVRLYNAGTVMLFIIAVLVVLIFVASILVGLTVVVQFLLFLTFGIMFTDVSTFENSERTVEDVTNGSLMELMTLGLGIDRITIHALWYLFIFIVVATTLALLSMRKMKAILKTISDFFGALINNIISLFTDMFFFFSKGDRDDSIEYVNYRDEESDIDKFAAKVKMQEFSRKKYSYKDYTNKFNSMRTVQEKYTYAYQTLVDCWGNIDFSLRGSDTPREIEGKVLARTTINEVPEITQIFEQYHYGNMNFSAGIETDPKILNQLSAMNKLIEKYYD